MACAICEIRRPRRFCPGVRGDICTLCCGAEREVTVHCPLDCEYLQEARKHEKPVPVAPDAIPNKDIRVPDEFLDNNRELLAFLSGNLLTVSMETHGVVDSDVAEGLEALIRTYRTLLSGVYYETRPPNPLADAVYIRLQQAVAEYRNRETQAGGVSRTRDAQVLGLLVFFQRLEISYRNGRKLGRPFINFLREYVHLEQTPRAPSLIVP